jgi:hypothetical protein
VPASIPQAVEVFSAGCTAGNAEACAEAGALLLAAAAAAAPARPAGAPPPAARAEALLRAGCAREPFDSRSGRCCEQLAALHLSPRRPPGAPPRPPDAQLAEWLRRGCDGEQPAACLRLAIAHRFGALGLRKDAAEAEALEARGLQWSGMSAEQAQKAVAAKAWGARG